MGFLELFAGGDCEWPARRGAPARFTFRVRDLSKVTELFHGMFIELSVRPIRGGGLAFCLDVPDRELGTWSIPVREGDRLKLARTAGECGARVACNGDALELAPFASGLRHDWSGKVAQAFAALSSGDPDAARRSLRPVCARSEAPPAAHHLLGRCYRALGVLDEAIDCYRAAVRQSADEAGLLHPFAAGVLSDMGVAYKKQGDPARAVHCFLHSLHLRPNHPEALLSFFSLMALDDSYVVFGASRVLALGGRDALVDEFLASYASFAKKSARALRADAERLAQKVDLTQWPLRRPGFGRLAAFERGLEGKLEAAAAARSGRWGPGTASA
jgi:tetratricopeptide (TPR) repeat protein